jgi:uncharacterized protein YneF (UPF0154 family)
MQIFEAAASGRERQKMESDKNIKIVSVLFGLAIAIVSGLVFSIPGLLLGVIVGVIAALSLKEWLHKNKPENRRRARRMMRNEGLR